MENLSEKEKRYIGRWCYNNKDSDTQISVDIVNASILTESCVDDTGKTWKMSDFKINDPNGMLFKLDVEEFLPTPDLGGFGGLVHDVNKKQATKSGFSLEKSDKGIIQELENKIKEQNELIIKLSNSSFESTYTKNSKTDLILNAIETSSNTTSKIKIDFDLEFEFDFKNIIKLCEMFNIDLNDAISIMISNINKNKLKDSIIKGVIEYANEPII